MAITTEGKLGGQVALITGASSGIGLAIARAFLNEGTDLVVVARRSERVQAVADEAQKHGRRWAVVAGDPREEETAARAVQTAIQQLGHLDVLVNNAGIGRYADLIGTSVDGYDAMMDTNMRSTFLFTRHMVPLLLERAAGAIITIASMSGVMGFACQADYCATKFAHVRVPQGL